MKAKGGSWSNKVGGKGPKGQGSLHDGQQFNNAHWKGGSAVWEAKGGAWNHAAKGGVWEGEHKEKDTQAKVERIGSMECLRRVVCRTEEAHGKQYLRTLGHPSSFCRKTNHLDWNYRTVLVPSVRPIRRRRSLWRLLITFRRCPVSLSLKRKW